MHSGGPTRVPLLRLPWLLLARRAAAAPVDIAQAVDSAASFVSAGVDHTCSMTPEGAARCWGGNDEGQTDVPAGVSFASISAGGWHTCGVTTKGNGRCWGQNNHGQTDVPAGVTFGSISAGRRHTCGVTPQGAARCWGSDNHGQADVPAGVTFASISAGSDHTCGVTPEGAARCWGLNIGRQTDVPVGALGLRWRAIGSDKPQKGVELVNAKLSKALQQKTKFTQDEWKTFGAKRLSTDTFIEVGVTTGTKAYFQPGAGVTFASISAGFWHTCGVTTEGAGRCWGSNETRRPRVRYGR